MQGTVKTAAYSTLVALFVWALGATGVPARAADDGHGGTSHKKADKGPAMPQGTVIRDSKVQGHTLSYRLYTWDERQLMMKGMEGHPMAGMDTSGKSTHHLMVFITGPDGKAVSGAKVGFIATGPDKAEFKSLTMSMFDGYGADLPLKMAGTHLIKTKAVVGDTTLTEEFQHLVK